MKISVVNIFNKNKICIWHGDKCYDIEKFLGLYAENQNPYTEKAFLLNEKVKNIDTDNFLAYPEFSEILESVYKYIKSASVSNDCFTLSSCEVDSSLPFEPPVINPPLMFGLAGNSPQKWRNKDEKIPIYPVGYQRPTESICGHNSRVTIPKETTSFRTACELGLVIGKEGQRIKKEDAFEYIFGFTCVNDMISNHWKDFVAEHNPHGKPGFPELLATSYYGRGTNGFAPLGPWVVSKDEVGDPYNLIMYTRFNNILRDRSYSNSMIVGIESTIEYLSSFMILKPGSIIHMGTMGIDGITLPQDLKLSEDDFVEIEIENIGKLKTYFKDMRFE